MQRTTFTAVLWATFCLVGVLTAAPTNIYIGDLINITPNAEDGPCQY